MLIGRHDIDNLMRRDPASAFLPTSLTHENADNHIFDAETDGVELEISGLLMKLRPIKQVILFLLMISDSFIQCLMILFVSETVYSTIYQNTPKF